MRAEGERDEKLRGMGELNGGAEAMGELKQAVSQGPSPSCGGL
jgi:hypothetical protein